MAFNGSGVFNLVSGNPVVTGTTISSTWANNTLSDVATGLSNCVTRDGQSPATANLPMGGYKLTGLALATATGDALSYGRAATVTDLTSSGTTTLSGGTANGVAYLNASKQVTTGSALTFDGTTFVAPFTSLSGNGVVLTVDRTGTGGNDRTNVQFSNSGTVRGGIGTVGASDGMYFNYGTTEGMRLTSTGLGIGTSSPQAKLQVLNALKVSSADQSSGNVILGDGSSTAFNVGIGRWNGSTNSAGAGGLGYFSQGAGNSGGHYFYVGDAAAGSTTKVMTLDTAGNLGLGVTPSGWVSTSKALELYGGGSLYANSSSNDLRIGCNVYINGAGSNTYKTTNPASMYYQSSGAYYWYTAPSGTAGTAITFTQAMTLDSSGNLLVGTTSNINSSTRCYLSTASDWQLVLNATNTSSGLTTLTFANGGVQKSQMYWEAGNSRFNLVNISGGLYVSSGGTSWTALSDERLKTDLKPIENAAQKVSTLRAITGRYKTDDENVSRAFLIAQDVLAVLPEAVDSSNPDELGLQYTDVIPLLVAAINELTARITTLEGK